jgi:PilZ domain-containing protein
VSEPCTVLISAPELLGPLTHRAAELPGELLAFSEADALIALEAITKRRPHIIVLERQFAATPRGAALINRIKADPALDTIEMRVMSADSDFMRVVPRAPAGSGHPPGGAGTAPATATMAAPTLPLDQRGTRRSPRYRISDTLEVLVDGNVATLVDLSSIGAQVISPTILRPNQRVRIALTDDAGNVRFNAAVAWASFEIPPGTGPRYRAGLEFVDADASAVDAFRARHQA